jgi:hypothetical protein
MRELVIFATAIAAIAIIGYLWQRSARAARQRDNHGSPGTARRDLEAGLSASAVRDVLPTAPDFAGTAVRAGKSAGLLQDAADSAAGVPYERASEQIEQMTADLAAVRRDAERTAERLANRAAEARVAIQAAAAAHGGAVPGDGTGRCPPSYPVKATMAAMRYQTPDQRMYNQTVPDICLKSVAAAEAAGFSGSADDATSAPEADSVEDDGGELALADVEPERPQAPMKQDRE